ncbi:MAG: hypothetical protein ACI4R6_05500, partial [Lachnospiraceae bacterium]
LLFENAEANIALYFKNLEITGYNYDVRFVNAFDRECQDGITESYFLLESGDYLLNAVYTHTDKSDAPSVLLIPGSGVSDYNVTIVIFDDISHFGYKIDALDTSSLYRTSAFPDDLADTFAGFC